MSFHGYKGSNYRQPNQAQRLCVCGWKSVWAHDDNVEVQWRDHIDQAAAAPSMQELLARKAASEEERDR